MAQGSGITKKNISFKKVKDKTLGDVFGTKPISAGEIMGLVWKVIKKYDLRDAGDGATKKKKKKSRDEDDD